MQAYLTVSYPHYYSTTISGSAHLLGEFFIICLPTSGCFTTCAPPFLHQKQRIILVLDFDFISLNPGSVISKLCDQQQVAFPIKKNLKNEDSFFNQSLKMSHINDLIKDLPQCQTHSKH